MSEWSPQYHIEKLQIVEQSNTLDITKDTTAKSYFFGEQTQTLEDGYQVEADGSRDTLLIGSDGVDRFVINGIEGKDRGSMWLYGADFEHDDDSNSDDLTLKLVDKDLFTDITDALKISGGDFEEDGDRLTIRIY